MKREAFGVRTACSAPYTHFRSYRRLRGLKPRRGGLLIAPHAPKSSFCFWAARPGGVRPYARDLCGPRRPKTKSEVLGAREPINRPPLRGLGKGQSAPVSHCRMTFRMGSEMRVRCSSLLPLWRSAAVSKAAASCTHSKRFATEDARLWSQYVTGLTPRDTKLVVPTNLVPRRVPGYVFPPHASEKQMAGLQFRNRTRCFGGKR